MDAAAQTSTAFRTKWTSVPDLAFEATNQEGSGIQRWILERNGWDGLGGLRRALHGRRRVLDAGCGNGRVSALLRTCMEPDAELVAVDLTAADVAARNLAELDVRVATHDLLEPLDAFGAFDLVYCQEVLHHTADPAKAFRNLADALAPGGTLAVYVYRRKGPVRESTDRFIHERMQEMDDGACWETSRQIAAFGAALSRLGARVTVPRVDVLGIPAGEYDVQRLLYQFFFKCFHDPEGSAEHDAAINYDWYRPALASRHEPEEVQGWFEDSGLKVTRLHVDPYGITAHGTRAGAR